MGEIRFFGGQRDAALGANGRAGHFAMRKFVFGQDRSRIEYFVANIALDPATSCWRQQICAGRPGAWWVMGRLHVNFQLRPRLARLAAIGAMQTQVE